MRNSQIPTSTHALLPTSTHSNGFCIIRVCISSISSWKKLRFKKSVASSASWHILDASNSNNESRGIQTKLGLKKTSCRAGDEKRNIMLLSKGDQWGLGT
jgi:hypothetical protein